ncbi:MAG: hypothetical protein WBO36_02290 [Saprospiraceae bacterium]
MKKLKFFLATFVVTIFIFGLYSCTKEEISDTQEITKNIVDINSINIDLDKVSDGFGQNYAIFSNATEFANFITKYGSISEDNRIKLLKKRKYISLDTYLNEIVKGMDKLNSKDDVDAYIIKYQNILELQQTDQGEDILAFKNITKHGVKPFLNVDMIVKVGDEFLKYVDTYAVYANEYSKLLNLHSIEDIKNSGLQFHKAYNVLSKESFKKNQIELRTLGNYFFDYATYDVSWCKNDRRVSFEIGIYEYWFNLGGIFQITIDRRAEANATKKGIPCIWYANYTEITWNNFNMAYNFTNHLGVTSNEPWVLPNLYQHAHCITRGETFYVYQSNWGGIATYSFTKMRSDLITTGMANHWLIINR